MSTPFEPSVSTPFEPSVRIPRSSLAWHDTDPVPGRVVEPIHLRKIAACVDGSPYGEHVVAHAVRIATALDADLTLLRVIETHTTTPPDPVAWGLRAREAREELARMADEASQKVGPVSTVVIEGDAPDQIRQWVSDNAIDMTVLAAHGDRGSTDWGIGGTARKLIDLIPGSLFLVPGAGPVANSLAYQTILVPLDGSSHAESVLPLAQQLAEGDHAGILLAHIVPVPELTETAPMENEARELRERLIGRNRRVADEYLQRLSSYTAGNVGVRTASQVADVRSGLAAIIAAEHPDLVVLSAHGRGRRADVPFGTVAGYLIAHASVPLLIVRGRQSIPARMAAPARLPAAAGK